jgi:rhodanese-related sulfurtransferase
MKRLGKVSFMLSLFVCFYMAEAGFPNRLFPGMRLMTNRAAAEEFAYIMPDELLRAIKNGADIVVVSNMDSDTYAKGHIKGAVNVLDVESGVDPGLPRNKLLVVYCGCDDEEGSKMLAQKLVADLSYRRSNIRILKGGWFKWVELGYPVEKGKVDRG